LLLIARDDAFDAIFDTTTRLEASVAATEPAIFPRCSHISRPLNFNVALALSSTMDSTLPHMLQEQLDNPNSGYYPAEDIPGGLPINLDSLRDGPPGSKPFYPYSTLIRCVSLPFSLSLTLA